MGLRFFWNIDERLVLGIGVFLSGVKVIFGGD